MSIADLVQDFPWVRDRFGPHIARLIGIAPVERTPVKAVAGRATGLVYRYTVLEVACDVVQLTDHRPADVRWPATDHVSRVVYELKGELRILDLAGGEDRAVPVVVPDDGLWKRPKRI